MFIWFRHLRLRTRIFLIVCLLLVLGIGGYVGVRFIQYQAAASVPLEQFVPLHADVVAGLRDPRSFWDRIKRTEPYLVVENGILKDPVLRSHISEGLARMGLPTLDELSDRRRMRDWEPYLTEDFVFRFFGEQAMVAVTSRNSTAGPEVLVLGRLSFGDFLLWPFASWAASGKGIRFQGDRIEISMGSRTLWGSVQGNVVLAATSAEMLDSALKRNGPSVPYEGPLYVSLAVDASRPLGDFLRREAAMPPWGMLLHHVDLTGMSRLDIRGDVLKRDLDLHLRLTGARRINPDLVPPVDRLLQSVPPENTFLVQPFLSDVGVLWSQVDALWTAPSSGTAGLAVFRPFMQLLREHRIDQRLFPYLMKGALVMAGNEIGQGNRDGEGPFPVLAMVFRIKENEGKKVAWVMEDVTRNIVGNYENVTMAAADYKGHKLHFFFMKSDPLRINSIFRPCYAVVNGHLVFTTSLPYLEKIMDALTEEGASFRDSPLYRSMAGSKSSSGNEPDPVMATGLDVHGLFTGLFHLSPISAGYFVDNDALRQKIRDRLKREHPRQPSQDPNDYEATMDAMVLQAVRDEEQAMAQTLQERIRILEYIHYLAVRTEKGDGDVQMDIVITPGKR